MLQAEVVADPRRSALDWCLVAVRSDPRSHSALVLAANVGLVA